MISNKIQELRKKTNLTVRELAIKAEITHSMVSNFENNKAIPGTKVIHKLAKAFNIPTEELFAELKATELNIETVKEFKGKLMLAESIRSEESMRLISHIIDLCLEKEKMISALRGLVK
jgi:transcriptional regulator with XRE-family HTH domain